MNYGFLKVAAATPKIQVGNCMYNADEIIKMIKEANNQHVSMIVFPELCITGYTCEDLFLQDSLLDMAKKALLKIVKETENMELVSIVGLPLVFNGVLYNVAAVVCKGEILGFVPKSIIPNYSEFYESRHFTSGVDIYGYVDPGDPGDEQEAWFSTNMLFKCTNMPEFVFGVEICEDLWAPMSPSIGLALAGATVIANLSASNETTGKMDYRKKLVSMQSAKCLCGYIYANAGEGESTTDVVFPGHNLIAENGRIIAESKRFETGMIVSYLDLQKIANERRRIKSFATKDQDKYTTIEFDIDVSDVTGFDRKIDSMPFVPKSGKDRDDRCEEIITIQAMGLKKRMEHTNCKCAVVGISGGLDSTLALLATANAFDRLNLDRKNIIAVTMPGFGTTDRTYTNAVSLINSLGATFKEISIVDGVKQHFKDINHDLDNHDVTYENGQARYRTLLLMDLANKYNGLVIGTGDLSELALGWATYNGDHMSMYGVNGGIPKTLIRHLVRFYADTCDDKGLSDVLKDVLDTPVSPELLPPEDGKISQKTEDLVGPYELHDFFLYYALRFGFSPEKVYFLACHAFAKPNEVKGSEAYDKEVILKWLKVFYRRFFAQQFKRSCLPDGPKVGSVAVSPRGDLRMPSDAVAKEWLDRLEKIDI
ncbi:MAG TPA: NAD(+) synthase [Eubacterium sp.]|nr:NAD(+) synthase [Eubacterium sp.]